MKSLYAVWFNKSEFWEVVWGVSCWSICSSRRRKLSSPSCSRGLTLVLSPAPPRPGYTWRYTWYLFLSKAKKYPRTVTQPLASHVLSVVLSSCLLAQAAPGWGWWQSPAAAQWTLWLLAFTHWHCQAFSHEYSIHSLTVHTARRVDICR